MNFLFSLCFFAASVCTSATSAEAQTPPEQAVQWRRTVNGWERADLWGVGEFASTGTNREWTKPLPPPEIHPIFVAGFMLAAAALMAVGAGSYSTQGCGSRIVLTAKLAMNFGKIATILHGLSSGAPLI